MNYNIKGTEIGKPMHISDINESKVLLQTLASSDDPAKRQEAIEKLGQFPASNREIVRALLITEMSDDNPAVQLAAMHALLSPHHQQTLMENPDLRKEARGAAAMTQSQTMDEQKSIVEFERRRTPERSYYFALIGSSVLLCGLFFLLGLVNYGLVVFMILFSIFFWLSWKNWRCPNCNVWFDYSGTYVNAFLSSGPLWCPKCKSRLL